MQQNDQREILGEEYTPIYDKLVSLKGIKTPSGGTFSRADVYYLCHVIDYTSGFYMERQGVAAKLLMVTDRQVRHSQNACESLGIIRIQPQGSESRANRIYINWENLREVLETQTGMLTNVRGKKRFDVLKRDNFTCQYCGAKAPDVRLQVDHKKPTSKGGADEMDNLITACVDCNMGKSDRWENT